MHTELAYRDDIAVGGGILYTDILYYVCTVCWILITISIFLLVH